MSLRYKAPVCYGISSITKDNQHIFMIDYDTHNLNKIRSSLINIQYDFDLSDIYILKTTNGYNAFSMDKLGHSLLYMIGVNTPLADRRFFDYGFKKGYYVLRIDGNDKEIVDIMTNPSHKYEKSTAHAIFFKHTLGIRVDATLNYDNHTECDIIGYRSMRHGYHNR